MVAYFCMEYGLDASVKTYAGGLGILAGDYIKGAKDHDFPMVAIGIKWKQGYSDQLIGEDGEPYDAYHNYEYDFLKDTGVKVSVKVRNQDVVCKVWESTEFGTIPLYLLDTDIPENDGVTQWIGGQLYGWFKEERIAQEIVLGIGGVRTLRALGIQTDVYHFNEGHAVFAGLELIREKQEKGMNFENAIKASRNEIVFTTHTPVVEGNESHEIDMLMFMGASNGLTWDQLARLGGVPFNMTVAALRLSKISNGVAELHGHTANNMWKGISEKSNIISVTNAIHLGTWVDNSMLEGSQGHGDLWESHMTNKRNLIQFIKERNNVQLNPDALLIGFARRAAPYKRSNFIFTREDIIDPLLRNGKLQIVFSGKAHPLDDGAKETISTIVKMSKKYPESVVFLENYDMTIGRMLTRGADVWLNNPRRPLEASGTSGMKAAMNGVLNLSILDGWWPEACDHGVNGWQFGNAFESNDVAAQDANDIAALYRVLLDEVMPTYYNDRNKWVEMMKNSIISTKDKFAVKRMLEEYYEKMYCLEI